jgi:tRNA-specific 2-thiouridylase
MGMPHFTLDLRHEFRAGVVDPFLEGHAAGETPNPCIRCNGNVRLDAMLEMADRLGAQHLATGHYARVTEHEHARGPLLRAAADVKKDQTYMLAALQPSSLARLRFPLGDLTKPEVRAIAAEAELPVADKIDSMDLCFLAGTSRHAFLRRHGGLAEEPGEIVDPSGRVLGRHRGHHAYTVGQRKGLGISDSNGVALYVLEKDPRRNRVVAGTLEQLRTTNVAIRGARLQRDGARVDGVKLRYHAPPLPARVKLPDAADGDAPPAAGVHKRLQIELGEPIDGAAPGQMACLMDGDVVVGWGTIA